MIFFRSVPEIARSYLVDLSFGKNLPSKKFRPREILLVFLLHPLNLCFELLFGLVLKDFFEKK